MFEGELLLWNWETGESGRSLPRSPEVARVVFDENGSNLVAFVRPWDESIAEDDPDDSAAFDLFFELEVPFFFSLAPGLPDPDAILRQMAQQSPKSAAAIYADKRFPSIPADPEQFVCKYMGLIEISQRSPIWDVSWFNHDEIGFVHDDCLLQVMKLDERLTRLFEGDGNGCQVFCGDQAVVHVTTENDGDSSHEFRKSALYHYDGEGLRKFREFVGSHTFSRACDGRLLGRRDRSRVENASSKDVLITGDKSKLLDLSHYDVFNEYLRIDAAPYLFFLQSHEGQLSFEELFDTQVPKHLCMLEKDGSVRRLWPILDMDGTDASHAMECSFTYLSDALGEGVVVAGKHYNPGAAAGYAGFLYRKDLWDGKEIWRIDTPASCSTIVVLQKFGLLAAFFLNGEFALLSANTGQEIRWEPFLTRGLPNVVFSCAVQDDRLVLGTVDGQLTVIQTRGFVS